jgi:hypothetical protein
VPGYDNNALKCDGRDDYVELPTGSLIGSLSNASFLIWADFAYSGGARQRICHFSNGPDVYMALAPRHYYVDRRWLCCEQSNGYRRAKALIIAGKCVILIVHLLHMMD